MALLPKGERVVAEFLGPGGGPGMWYPGFVSDVNDAGRYFICYDDGDTETDVPPARVKAIASVPGLVAVLGPASKPAQTTLEGSSEALIKLQYPHNHFGQEVADTFQRFDDQASRKTRICKDHARAGCTESTCPLQPIPKAARSRLAAQHYATMLQAHNGDQPEFHTGPLRLPFKWPPGLPEPLSLPDAEGRQCSVPETLWNSQLLNAALEMVKAVQPKMQAIALMASRSGQCASVGQKPSRWHLLPPDVVRQICVHLLQAERLPAGSLLRGLGICAKEPSEPLAHRVDLNMRIDVATSTVELLPPVAMRPLPVIQEGQWCVFDVSSLDMTRQECQDKGFGGSTQFAAQVLRVDEHDATVLAMCNWTTVILPRLACLAVLPLIEL